MMTGLIPEKEFSRKAFMKAGGSLVVGSRSSGRPAARSGREHPQRRPPRIRELCRGRRTRRRSTRGSDQPRQHRQHSHGCASSGRERRLAPCRSRPRSLVSRGAGSRSARSDPHVSNPGVTAGSSITPRRWADSMRGAAAEARTLLEHGVGTARRTCQSLWSRTESSRAAARVSSTRPDGGKDLQQHDRADQPGHR